MRSNYANYVLEIIESYRIITFDNLIAKIIKEKGADYFIGLSEEEILVELSISTGETLKQILYHLMKAGEIQSTKFADADANVLIRYVGDIKNEKEKIKSKKD